MQVVLNADSSLIVLVIVGAGPDFDATSNRDCGSRLLHYTSLCPRVPSLALQVVIGAGHEFTSGKTVEILLGDPF